MSGRYIAGLTVVYYGIAARSGLTNYNGIHNIAPLNPHYSISEAHRGEFLSLVRNASNFSPYIGEAVGTCIPYITSANASFMRHV